MYVIACLNPHGDESAVEIQILYILHAVTRRYAGWVRRDPPSDNGDFECTRVVRSPARSRRRTLAHAAGGLRVEIR